MSSREAWSTALVSSYLSTSDTTSNEGMASGGQGDGAIDSARGGDNRRMIARFVIATHFPNAHDSTGVGLSGGCRR